MLYLSFLIERFGWRGLRSPELSALPVSPPFPWDCKATFASLRLKHFCASLRSWITFVLKRNITNGIHALLFCSWKPEVAFQLQIFPPSITHQRTPFLRTLLLFFVIIRHSFCYSFNFPALLGKCLVWESAGCIPLRNGTQSIDCTHWVIVQWIYIVGAILGNVW